MISIAAVIVVLGVLIFVHELGHFIFAKLFGVGVEKFSLGFGSKLFGWKSGETEYLVSAIPFGGYVKMVGEGDEGELSEEDKTRSFQGKSAYKRIVIVAAGPLFNLFFACLVLITLFMAGVPVPTAKIGEVLKDKPAARAGLQAGDVVTSINGKEVKRWEDFSDVVADSKGRPVHLQIRRGSNTFTMTLQPEMYTGKNLFGDSVSTPIIGVKASNETFTERFSPPNAVVRGVTQTGLYIRLTILSLVKIIERAISFSTIGGPIMIAVMSGQQASEGAVSFLHFMALLSVNLGVLNLLPVPVLDGGHLFFFVYEVIFRKPFNVRAREIAQQIGLALLVTLMFFATFNDIVRYWDSIMKFVMKFVH